MFHESTFDAGSVFGSGLFIEDFLPVLSVIAFGYIVSCLAFALLNQTWYLRGISNYLLALSPPDSWVRHGGIFYLGENYV